VNGEEALTSGQLCALRVRSPEVLASCLVFQKGRSHGKIECVVWPSCRGDLQQRLSFSSTLLPGSNSDKNELKRLKEKGLVLEQK